MFAMLQRSLAAINSSQVIPGLPICVLMGNTGAGKTTLCNNLCGTHHESGAGRQSITRQLFQNPVNCGSNPLAIVDTPGIDSQVDAFKHALLLKEGLTGAPINTIFFVIKYDSRFDNTLLDYAKLLVPVEKYSYKIVVMISHMDLSKNSDADEKQIREIFYDEYDKFSKFIFYSEKDDPSLIADKMHFYASSMTKETLQISDEEFNLKFNIYEMRARIKVAYDKFLRQTKQIEEDYAILIKEVEQTGLVVQEKDEMLHMCIVSFRNELESLTDDFIKTHGADMQELDSYGFLLMMQKEKIRLCNEFTQYVSSMMSYCLLDTSDPRNMIKRCPHCQEIWFKVAGCDGSTTCGKRPTDKLYDVLTTPWWRFTFTRFGRKIQWEKVNMGTVRNTAQSSTISDGIGCGKAFVWKDQPPVEEEKIKELFQVKTIEEVKEIIRRTDYSQMRQKYADNIDKKRYN
jgi:GTPase Era involved in 16S rRNA processing